jgi:hypothetical protein
MAWVAKCIRPSGGFARQIELPMQDVLTLCFRWCNAQHLDAAANQLVIAIAGFVKNMQLHAMDSK